MPPPRYRSMRVAGAVLIDLTARVTGISPAGSPVQTTRVEPASAADAAAITEFMKRVDAYVALHRKLESAVPKAPAEATPRQIDQAQRSLLTALQSERAEARPGDVFTPAMTALVKRLMVEVFSGPGGVPVARRETSPRS